MICYSYHRLYNGTFLSGTPCRRSRLRAVEKLLSCGQQLLSTSAQTQDQSINPPDGGTIDFGRGGGGGGKMRQYVGRIQLLGLGGRWQHCQTSLSRLHGTSHHHSSVHSAAKPSQIYIHCTLNVYNVLSSFRTIIKLSVS